ncbi:cupin-like domain-containing protein [Pelagophyceae sp. CCMP2097]|nr:cupin-like domain-containing protein [Pelagophyceae sp. CCMP2097]
MAEAYRDAEVPFKVFGVPDIEAVRRSWTDAYLLDNAQPRIDGRRGVQFKVERSQNNHFMYWTHKSNVQRKFPGWKSPTQILSGTKFKTWLGWAKAADASRAGPDAPHHYLMMGTAPLSEQLRRTSDHFVTRDLPMFVPREAKGNFFVTRPSANKGVQCRFGMRGVIAEAHYDGGRNMVAMLKGAKRYVLSPPSACGRLGLIADRSHPSFRHSTTDWSDPAEAETAFAAPDAVAVDTVLREGEVLYIPSFWVHYIVSLRYSVQCNTRSGFPPRGEGEDYVNDCMGKTPANDARETAGAAERRGGKHHKLRGGAN